VTVVDDRVAELLADPLAMIADLDEATVARYVEAMDPVERAEFLRWLESQVPWRDNPATFAHELTGGEWRLWRYSVLLGERFRDAVDGVAPNQMWMLPSQMGKTSHVQWGIVWALDRNPRLRIMYVSYSAEKAVEIGGECRDLVVRHADRLRFRLRADRRARGKWETPEGGGLYCVGVDGGITGFPQDFVIGDDLIKGWAAAHSAATREHVWAVWRSQIRMRLQAFENPKLVVGTRWHEDDIQARLRSAETDDPDADRWDCLRLPAVAETPDPLATDPLLREPDPLGREPGEIIEPERFPAREVRARAAALGSYLAAAMEQQRPSPPEGNVIKREWWKLDLEDKFSGEADQWLGSWDMKLKEKESGDYTVGQVWARTGADCWLVDQLRGQWDQATTCNAIALMFVRHPQCRRHLVENTGYGPEVMQALRTAMPKYVVSDAMAGQLGMTEDEREAVQAIRRRGMGGLVPNTPKGSKQVRARAVVPYIEGGDVHLPERAAWVPGFLDEMAAFGGGGAHDDQVDTMSQALAKLHRVGSGRTRTFGEQLRSTSAGFRGSLGGSGV
jgi:phage terminase large subunit-like protein